MLCIARTMLLEDVSLSARVNPSHADIVSNRQTYHQFFSLSCSHTILVFFIPNGLSILRWRPSRGRIDRRVYEKIAIFDQYLALYQKWYNTEPQLLWNANRKSNGTIYNDLEWLPTQIQGHAIIWGWISQKRYTRYTHSYNGILGTYARYRVSRNIPWYKASAVSLRQLSYILVLICCCCNRFYDLKCRIQIESVAFHES